MNKKFGRGEASTPVLSGLHYEYRLEKEAAQRRIEFSRLQPQAKVPAGAHGVAVCADVDRQLLVCPCAGDLPCTFTRYGVLGDHSREVLVLYRERSGAENGGSAEIVKPERFRYSDLKEAVLERSCYGFLIAA